MNNQNERNNYKNDRYFEFIKTTYYHEHDKKNHLGSKLRTSLNIYYLIVAGNIYFINKVNSFDTTPSAITFYSFLGLSILVTIFCLYLFVKYFSGQIYGHVPYAIDSKRYFDDLINYYKDTNSLSDKKQIDKDIDNYIEDTYVKATTISQKANEEKSELLNRIHLLLITTVILLTVTFVPLKISEMNSLDKNEISNNNCYKQKNERENSMSSQQNTNNTSKNSSDKPSAIKPAPPKVRKVKDGVVSNISKKGGKNDK